MLETRLYWRIHAPSESRHKDSRLQWSQDHEVSPARLWVTVPEDKGSEPRPEGKWSLGFVAPSTRVTWAQPCFESQCKVNSAGEQGRSEVMDSCTLDGGGGGGKESCVNAGCTCVKHTARLVD